MTAAYVMLALGVFWLAWQTYGAPKFRCDYCGELNGHEASCPYNLEREER